MAKACKQHLEKNIFAGLCFISVDVVGYQESLETKKKSILLVSDGKMYLHFDIP